MDHQDDPYQQAKRPAQQESSQQWPPPAYATRSRGPAAYEDPSGMHSNMYSMSQQQQQLQPGNMMYAQQQQQQQQQQYPAAVSYDPNAMLYNQPPPHQHHPQRQQYPPPGMGTAQQNNPYVQQQQQTFYSSHQQPQPPSHYATSSAPPHMAVQQQQHHHHHPGGVPQAIAYPPAASAVAPMQQHHHPYATNSITMAAPIAKPPPQQQQQQPLVVGRLPSERPLIKLSVALIDTYKHINTIYYEDRDARRAQRAKEKKLQQQQQQPNSDSGGAAAGASTTNNNNNGWDDENYDYIFTPGELFYGRYKIMERIGKGSFGQVVRAEDVETKRDVAIKIIKSKKPFLLQAKTEIELLTVLFEKDPDDQHNLVRLLTHFMYRNHQCLVFEMLSLNLYELLKNTQFGGVSLNLIKKFAKQVLKALTFLARKDVDIIHCDLKPENILLRHPKKSAVKVIDFGSSCRSNKRMYSYIQSRFYRSPEVMLGLPYSVSIDIWSLGCILAEMHTGEPLFSGSDQFDQMQKIVKLLGMVPDGMLEKASDTIKYQFFEKTKTLSGRVEWQLRRTKSQSGKQASDAGSGESPVPEAKSPVVPSTDPIASLSEVITAGSRQKKKYPPSETYNSQRNYELFVDLVHKMLAYRPEDRIQPLEALRHPFLASGELGNAYSTSPTAAAASAAAPY